MSNLPPGMTVNDLPQAAPTCPKCRVELVQCPCGNEDCMNPGCKRYRVPSSEPFLAELLHHLGVCSVDCALKYAKRV